MEKLDYLLIKCKEIGCPREILFTGEVEVPGNFAYAFIGSIENDSLFLNIGIQPQVYEPIRIIGESITAFIKIYQDQRNHTENELVYEKRQERPTHYRDRFYLTCENGHTHPYEIITSI